jgi:hypothetical protein
MSDNLITAKSSQYYCDAINKLVSTGALQNMPEGIKKTLILFNAYPNGALIYNTDFNHIITNLLSQYSITAKDNVKKEKAKDKVTTQLRESIIKKQIKEGTLKTGDPIVDMTYQPKKKEKIIKNPYKITKKYYLITVNPKECEISDILAIIKNISGKVWAKVYAYVIEQRGTTEETMGKGKHIHMIVDKVKEPYSTKKEIYAGVNKYCETPEHVNVVKLDEDGKWRALEYMKGEKIQAKQECQRITKLWREKNKIEDIYYSPGNKPSEEENNEPIKNIEDTYVIKKNNETYIKIRMPSGTILKIPLQ